MSTFHETLGVNRMKLSDLINLEIIRKTLWSKYSDLIDINGCKWKYYFGGDVSDVSGEKKSISQREP